MGYAPVILKKNIYPAANLSSRLSKAQKRQKQLYIEVYGGDAIS
jgi:hypothetical protein